MHGNKAKMKIICHMISTVDGRLYPSRWGAPQEPADITTLYEGAAKRFPAQGWIVGRTTMSDYCEEVKEGDPAPLRDADAPASPAFVGSREGRPIAVAIDPKGKLLPEINALPTGEHLVLVLGPRVAESHLAKLRAAGVSYVFEGEGESNREKFAPALKALEELFDAKTLLLEGGGIINGAFLTAGLIDEISVIVYPGLDALFGSAAIFGVKAPADQMPGAGAHLRLLDNETLEGGAVWLHYDVKND